VAADAAWTADPNDRRQVAAEKAIAEIRERVPRSARYFDDAYGFAILPSVTRIGFGFGGAYGKGLVIERDRLIGTTGFWQFTSGIQAGARNFSMVILFRDKAALDLYTAGKAQFLGQAGLAVANRGIAGTPAYNDGVAIFVVTRLALMGEFTVSGAKFTFKPLAEGAGSD
jgi:lipid-binding SYLF domain-containing protein